jgi:hypothetical protein
MGVHVCLVDRDFNDHPEWDDLRKGDDRDLFDSIPEDQMLFLEYNDTGEYLVYFRDSETVIKAIEGAGLEPLERYKFLVDQVYTGKWFLYFSY